MKKCGFRLGGPDLLTARGLIWAIDVLSRETTLFAAVGFAIGGLDDLAVDLIYLVRRLYHW